LLDWGNLIISNAKTTLTIANEVLSIAKDFAEQVEVFSVEASSTPVYFEANAIKGVDANDASGVALRIIKDGRIGFSSTSDIDDLKGLVNAALETAPFGAEAEFNFPGPQNNPNVVGFDELTNAITLEEMVELGENMISKIRALSSEVQVEGSVSKSTSNITLVNSNGVSIQYPKTRFGIGFEGTVIRGEDMLFTFDGLSSVSPVMDTSDIVNSIDRQLQWAATTATVNNDSLPVIFLPTAISSVILSPLLAGLNGKSVLLGTSPLIEKLGEKIVDERFTLLDDPTLQFISGSRPCDDEGMASRQIQLINEGVVNSFFYDLQTAGKAGTTSTGSGERGLGSLPSPSTGVLLVEPGKSTLAEMITSVKEGLIIERLLGAGQGNVLGGDFNANVLLGYKIEHGEVVGRVKDTMIAGNAYNVLNQLIELGSDNRWLGGGLNTPSIMVNGVSISSKG
tara:strand:- start:7367 stop:8725 length:1359 start_codon:yes stop_codon:yes gene_type:complete